MNDRYQSVLGICKRHAERLTWAMEQLQKHFPLTAESVENLTPTEQAMLDQFAGRFAKLQDAMGVSLFPAVLERMKEPPQLTAFLDKLYQLEKIGAIDSAEQWLLLREMRNQFAHDYPEDPQLQAQLLNKSYELAKSLVMVLQQIEHFVENRSFQSLPLRGGVAGEA
jgi:hypothetical protein